MKSLKKFIPMPTFHEINYLSGCSPTDQAGLTSFSRNQAFSKTESTATDKLSWIKNALQRWAQLFNTGSHPQLTQASNAISAPSNPDTFSQKQTIAEACACPDKEWVPLIKARKHVDQDLDSKMAHPSDTNQANLAGQAILCVGGRAALYPDYLRLVETAGGCFMSYRTSPDNNQNHLESLLDRVNMVICPVDCINHDDYFAVKRHCKLTGKACAFLSHSSLPTFREALKMLITRSSKKQ